MKELKDLFKKPVVVIGLGFIVTIVIVGLAGYSFLMPQFTALGDNQKKTADLDTKLALLNKNIASIKSINKTDLGKYDKAINALVPENRDYLHFASLNDQLAKSAGLGITSFTISISVAPNAVAAAPTAAVSTGSAPGSSASKSPAAAAPAPTTVVSTTAGYNVTASYSGGFAAISKLLKNLKNLDRAVGVSKITFSTSQAALSTSITYFLPLSTVGQVTVSSDSLVTLSSSDIDLLNSLSNNTEFIAAPSTKPLGKSNPFE